MPTPPDGDLVLLRDLFPRPSTVSRRRGSGGTRYIPVPRPSSPTAYVPSRPPKVTTALLRSVGGFTMSRRWARSVLSFPGVPLLFGALPGGVRIHAEPEHTILAALGEAVGVPVHASIQLGKPRANRKPVLHLVDSSGTTVAWAKVGVDPLTSHRIAHEARVLRDFGGTRPGSLRTPRLLATGRWREFDYLILEPLATAGGRGVDAPALWSALRELVAAFPQQEQPLAGSAWWSALTTTLRGLRSPGADKLRRVADLLVEADGPRPLRLGATHGDWSPWNTGVADGVAMAWDWERFDPLAPVGLDVLHYRFQRASARSAHELSEVADSILADAPSIVARNGAPAVEGRFLAMLYLVQQGVRFLADGQEEAGNNRGDIESWLIDPLLRAAAERSRP